MLRESVAGAPAVAVDWNVTGDPVNPALLAVVDWVPGAGPSVRKTWAIPLALVTDVADETAPPPEAAQFTVTLGASAPAPVMTLTDSGVVRVVPTVPD